MAEFKVRVGAEFDASGLDAAIRKAVNKDYDVDVNAKLNIDSRDAMSKARELAKQVDKAFKSTNPIYDIGDIKRVVNNANKEISKIGSMSSKKNIGANQLKTAINQAESYLVILSDIDKKLRETEDSDGLGLKSDDLKKLSSEVHKQMYELNAALDSFEAKSKDLGISEQIDKERAEVKVAVAGLQEELNRELSYRKNQMKFEVDTSGFNEYQRLIDNSKARQQEMLSSLSSGISDAVNEQYSAMRSVMSRDAGDFGVAEQLKKEAREASSVAKQEAAEIQSTFNRLRASFKEGYSLEKRMTGLDVDSAEYKQAQAALAALNREQDELMAKLGTNMTTSMYDTLVADMREARTEIGLTEAKLEDMRRKLASGYSKSLNLGDFANQFDNIRTKFESLERVPLELQKSFSSLESQYNNLSQIDDFIDKGDYESAIRLAERYKDSVDGIKNQLDEARRAAQQMSKAMRQQDAADALSQKKTNFSLQIDNWLDNNSAAADQFGDRLRDIQNRINDCNDSASFNKLKGEFTQVTLEAKNAGVAMMSFGDRLKRQFREYSSYVGIAGLFAAGAQAIRAMAQNVLEVDTAMTGLYRVTDMTAKQYDQLYSDMISASKEYGTTLTDTINATSDWVRAGFDADTALGLANVTAMYQHISDLDYDEASKNLLTAYNGFKDSFQEDFGGDAVAAVEHVADAFNELDNQFSITSAGLGEGLARSASALQLAGNTFEEAAALVGATGEVTQDPTRAGTAMRTLSLRLRGMKGELEALGEESEGVENISKMQGQILNMTKGEVNIFDDLGNFRSTYDIMKDIAEVYDELSSTDQANLLETIAGKNRANDVAALLSNFDTAIAMAETAENSAGSAAAENAKYLDSLQGRIDVMTSSLQALSTSALDSGFLKGGVSAITSLISGFTSLIDTVGLLPAAIGAATAGFSMFGKGIAYIDSGNGKLKIFGKTLGEISNIISSIRSSGGIGGFVASLGEENNPFAQLDKRMEKDKAAINQFKKYLDDGLTYQDAFDKSFAGSSASVKEYVQGTEIAKVSADDYEQSARNVTLANLAQQNSFKSGLLVLNEYNKKSVDGRKAMAQSAEIANTNVGKFMSNLNGAPASMGKFALSTAAAAAKTLALNVATSVATAGLTMLVSAGLDFAINGLMDFINRADNIKQAVEESTSSFKQQRDEIAKNKSSFDEAAQSYEKLSSGVNKLTGENISLSTDEYEEYVNAANTIASITPSLVSGYDAQGNAILDTTGKVEDLTQAYNDLIIAENNKYLNGDGENFEGFASVIEDFQNDMNKLTSFNGTLASGANTGIAQWLDDLFALETTDVDSIIDKFGGNTARLANGMVNILKDNGITLDGFAQSFGILQKDEAAKYISEAMKQYPNEFKNIVNELNDSIESSADETRLSMQKYLENAFLSGDYENISKQTQGIMNSVIGNLDAEFIDRIIDGKTGSEAETALNTWVDNLLATFDGMDAGVKEKLESAFNMQNLFESGEISLGEYQKKLKDVETTIDGLNLDEEVKQEIKLSLNIDDVQEQYDTLINRITKNTSLDSNAVKNFVDDISSEDFNILMSMELDGIDTIDELREALDLARVINGTLIEINIEADTQTITNLNEAMAASRTAAGLTTEQIENVNNAFANLDGYSAAKMFEETANGIRLNTQEYEKFSEELTNGKLREASDALQTYWEGLDVLDDKIQEARMSGAENIDELISQREQLRQNITATAQYASQLQGLTSAYKEWQDAESAGSDRDMYESVLSGFESIEDEISRGWLDDASKEFIELLSFDGESFSSIDDYINRWNQLGQAIDGTTYSVRDFFTVNEDGESTNQGVYNFLDAVDQLNDERFKIERDENGIITSFDFGVNGDAAVAEALGVSEELVNIILRASEDAGFVINLDGAYTQLADLQEAAKQAAIDLKSIGKTGMEFTLDTSDSEKFVAEMDEAKRIWESYRNEDGTINWNLDGAEEAVTLYSTLVAQADKLSDPVYMQLDTSQVETELQEPLTKMQEFDSLLARKHQIEINGGDVSKVSYEMDKIVDYLHNLDGETKVKLGIEGMSKEEIEAGLEQGTIEIPATVDLQVEMSENIEDIRMALLKLTGAISEEEYQFYIDARLNGEMEVRDDIENIKSEAYDAQETLNNLSDTKYDFNFDTTDMADLYGQIDKAKELLDQFRKEDGTVDLSVEGAAQAQQILAALLRQKEELDPPAIMQVEVEDPTSDVGRAMTAVQQLYSAIQERNINIAIGADTTEVDSQISRLVTQLTVLQQNNPELYANLGLNTADFNNALSTLNANIQAGVELDPNALSIVQSGLEGIDVDVLAKISGLDTSMVDEYVAPDKEATTIYDVNSSKVDRWKAPNKNGKAIYRPQLSTTKLPTLHGTANYTVTTSGSSSLRGHVYGQATRVNGTAHVNGTAFAHGDWSIKDSGTALVGELGQETVVRNGKFFTIGDNGAEFFNYKKGDIIFNHKILFVALLRNK